MKNPPIGAGDVRHVCLFPVFLPGESHGQRSLAGYSPWGRKESDMAEVTEHAHTDLKGLR